MTKMVNIGDLFTREELMRAAQIYREARPGTFAATAAKDIVEPVMDRINRVTGQENNARYFAYALEHFLTQPGVLDAMTAEGDPQARQEPGGGLKA